MNRKKWIGGSAIILLLILVAWFWLADRDGVQYRTARIGRGEIDSTISATGNCNAVVSVQVGSLVSGNIKELYADFNTKVKKDQLVARIDPALFEAKVQQMQAALDSARATMLNAESGVHKAEADVAAAKAALEAAKANVAKAKVAVVDGENKYKRRVEMFQQGLIAAEDRETAKANYDSAVAAYEAAQSQQQASDSSYQAALAALDVSHAQLAQGQAQVKQAAANLAQAQFDLEHTYIRAPVDGTVVARRMDVGQTVAASFQAPTLFEIAQDLTKMKVDTNVDEADIGRVKLNEPAEFTVDAYPSQSFRGQVTEIHKAPNNVQNVVTYDVVVGVSNPDLKLFPGMTANVRILADRQENALKLPNAALRFRPPDTGRKSGMVQSVHAASPRQESLQAVWVLGSDDKPRPVRVKLGITDGAYSQVVSGDLKEGDQVIVGSAGAKAAGNQPGAGGGRRGPGF